ncbi:MAG TPA: 1-acyl-sn-glycerol-3-phosphate acyltransferase [Gammaproteobacteria bacterium]|nr:1-acyl-sn-glycerol-3-phosphate acyltransferase [Gammaproteobacteria bacterium]
MTIIRSSLFLLLHITSVMVFSIVAILVWPLPFRVRYHFVSQWAKLNLWFLRVICGVSYRVIGQENIPDTPCLIMCKHQSAWETLALQAVFPPQVWVLKRELLWLPFFGWGLASLNPIAIDRGSGRKALNQVIQQGKKRLQSGAWVVIFPEGTRMPMGEMGKFGISGAMLAKEAACPIVPVAHNAGEVWPKHSFLKYAGQIELVIGPAIATENNMVKTATLNQQVYNWMAEQMEQIEGR